jgi:prevent-host-death family protein
MKQRLTSMELRQRLGEILDRVSLRQDQFVVERKGKPLAAIVPVHLLDSLQRAARLGLEELLDRDSTDLPQEEADSLADEAKHATRP